MTQIQDEKPFELPHELILGSLMALLFHQSESRELKLASVQLRRTDAGALEHEAHATKRVTKLHSFSNAQVFRPICALSCDTLRLCAVIERNVRCLRCANRPFTTRRDSGSACGVHALSDRTCVEPHQVWYR